MKNNNIYIFYTLQQKDIEWARRLHNDPMVLKMLTDPTTVTKKMQQLWFQTLKKSHKSKRLVVWFNKKKIGLIRLDDIDVHNHSICIGLDIEKTYRGKGHATPIYIKLLNHCFEELGMNRCWLFVAEYNTVALHLYKKLGFQEEGIARQALYRDNKFNNYILMSLLLDEYKNKYHEKRSKKIHS